MELSEIRRIDSNGIELIRPNPIDLIWLKLPFSHFFFDSPLREQQNWRKENIPSAKKAKVNEIQDNINYEISLVHFILIIRRLQDELFGI